MSTSHPANARTVCADRVSVRISCVLLPAFVLAACSSPARIPPRPLGVTDHLAEADQHEADARRHELLATDAEARKAVDGGLICGDRALAAQASSGGAPLTPRPPCWTTESDAITRHRTAAAHLRADARTHRAVARQLMGAARDACESLPEGELATSPFSHRDDIRTVEAVVEGDRVRGARIVFARVDGLTAAWLERSLACHQALAAAGGYDVTYMPHCPAAVAGAHIEAEDSLLGPVVVISADDPATALAIYGRAEDLLRGP
jgi:hypothetical protein